jgi:hypothetical protein
LLALALAQDPDAAYDSKFNPTCTQVSETVFKQKCTNIIDKKCETVYETKYETKNEEVCDTIHRKECKEVITDVSEQFCTPVYQQKCTTEQKSSFINVFRDECTDTTKQVIFIIQFVLFNKVPSDVITLFEAPLFPTTSLIFA